uniref:Uncharacterized protein n=1 Tax=Anguilla anguilla TaxID=7936 RepID=A0A0E9T012_ANGAN
MSTNRGRPDSVKVRFQLWAFNCLMKQQVLCISSSRGGSSLLP